MVEEFNGPTLADAICQLRGELEEALQAGEGHAVRFGVESVEVEFTVEARRAVGGDAGVRFYVVSLGGKGEQQRAETNRVTVSLKPIGPGGERLQVASHQQRRPDARPDRHVGDGEWVPGRRPDAVLEDDG